MCAVSNKSPSFAEICIALCNTCSDQWERGVEMRATRAPTAQESSARTTGDSTKAPTPSAQIRDTQRNPPPPHSPDEVEGSRWLVLRALPRQKLIAKGGKAICDQRRAISGVVGTD
ncbi:hypothetical protein TSMEX_005417 [Taenia solium]|eukprot:TsM_000711100 transcript=TsM_000711100 gene=TsM_000711100